MKNHSFPRLYFKKRFIIPILGIMALLFSLNIYAETIINESFATIKDKTIQLEVADTHEKRQQGYMFRENIADDEGMIFVFDKPQNVYFWMKNVKNPLDILFISQNKIVTMYNMVPICEHDPCIVYPSKYKVDYAIEVKGGFCYKNNIKVGQPIKLSNNLNRIIKAKNN